MSGEKGNLVRIVIKGIVFAGILIIIPLYIWFFQHRIIDMFSSVDNVKAFILENKAYGALAYIGAQVVQMIICLIPGQPFQFAAGYIYGIWIALLLSIAGAIIGETLAFFMAKLLGRDAMYMFFGKTKAVKYIERLDTKNGFFILFLLYFIPGFPKDAVNYLAGLSKIKWGPFLIITVTARIIPMLGSICVGVFTKSQQWNLVVAIVIIVIVITVISYKHKEKALKWADNIYEKLIHLKY